LQFGKTMKKRRGKEKVCTKELQDGKEVVTCKMYRPKKADQMLQKAFNEGYLIKAKGSGDDIIDLTK